MTNMADEGDSLETILNNATNPAMRDVDWDYITNFCDQVNKELEGPQIAVRLIAHKVQSPQEREALFALTTLESCVKNCGRRFHQEIGKFKFLNELIKVVSPKYLGTRTTEKVKKRCIELIYSWGKGLPHETKIAEAYKMLKTQGIVKEDPTYVDQTIDHVPPPKPRAASFEDEEKSKLLAKLLKSKNPHDLQAANRLIKSMVKQDAEKMEKVSKRINELETINNNVKLLSEMLEHYNSSSSAGDRDMMKELYESLEKLRPNLFRLASDADEKDNAAIMDILKSNDEVMRVMSLYKKKVEGITEQNGESPSKAFSNNSFDGNTSALLDLSLDQPPASVPQSSDLSTEILDEELLALGLKGDSKQSDSKNNTDSLLGDLDEIFAASSHAQTQSQAPQSLPAMSSTFPAGGQGTFQAMGQPVRGPPPNYTLPQSVSQGFTPVMTQVPQASLPVMRPAQQGFTGFSAQMQTGAKPPPTEQQQKALDDLDLLGQNLMQQSLPKDNKIKTQDTGQQQKKTLNQMVNSTASTTPLIQSSQFDAALKVSPVVNSTVSVPSTAPTLSTQSLPLPTSSPQSIPPPPQVKPSQEVLPLTDLFVPLEKIQPGSTTPINAYDKNGLKIVIHFAKDKPREDVTVMVVSTISTNTNPVKKFVFQAAVPKIMKVKLQPPSATDLPAYNPILPPAAITQVMLVANPQKERIRLKFKITYTLNEENCSDFGEVESAPV